MPRAARKKEPTAIYHVMSRSITEFDLFPDNSDKEYFLDILLKCKEKFIAKVYGYCLMTNHYHLIIDTCGYDISKFMKSLNQSYVRYINKKYCRKGHLLTERFNSKIIDSDEYLLTVSAYIHNNCKDLQEYRGKEATYPYSSMGVYVNKFKDKRNLVDPDFILICLNETDRSKAACAYEEMVIERRDLGINKKLREYLEEFKKEQYEYKSFREVILRNKKPEEIISAIAKKFGIEDTSELKHRWKRHLIGFRSLSVYVLTTYCGIGIKEVCKYMNNISASGCSMLGGKGYDMVKENRDLKLLIQGLIKS